VGVSGAIRTKTSAGTKARAGNDAGHSLTHESAAPSAISPD